MSQKCVKCANGKHEKESSVEWWHKSDRGWEKDILASDSCKNYYGEKREKDNGKNIIKGSKEKYGK